MVWDWVTGEKLTWIKLSNSPASVASFLYGSCLSSETQDAQSVSGPGWHSKTKRVEERCDTKSRVRPYFSAPLSQAAHQIT